MMASRTTSSTSSSPPSQLQEYTVPSLLFPSSYNNDAPDEMSACSSSVGPSFMSLPFRAPAYLTPNNRTHLPSSTNNLPSIHESTLASPISFGSSASVEPSPLGSSSSMVSSPDSDEVLTPNSFQSFQPPSPPRPTTASGRRNLKNLSILPPSQLINSSISTPDLQSAFGNSGDKSNASAKTKRRPQKLDLRSDATSPIVSTTLEVPAAPVIPPLVQRRALKHALSTPAMLSGLKTSTFGPPGGMTLPKVLERDESGLSKMLRPAKLTLPTENVQSSIGAECASPSIRTTQVAFDMSYMRDESENNEDQKSPTYPDGPIAIYDEDVYLYQEPSAEEAARFDLVINAASEVNDPFVEKPHLQKPEYIHLPWEHNTDIVAELMGLCKTIDTAVKSNKKVLVHCQQGASRSASLIIAYGFYRNPKLSVNDAYYAAQAKSRWIAPNMKLMYCLQDFHKEVLQANGIDPADRISKPGNTTDSGNENKNNLGNKPLASAPLLPKSNKKPPKLDLYKEPSTLLSVERSPASERPTTAPSFFPPANPQSPSLGDSTSPQEAGCFHRSSIQLPASVPVVLKTPMEIRGGAPMELPPVPSATTSTHSLPLSSPEENHASSSSTPLTISTSDIAKPQEPFAAGQPSLRHSRSKPLLTVQTNPTTSTIHTIDESPSIEFDHKFISPPKRKLLHSDSEKQGKHQNQHHPPVIPPRKAINFSRPISVSMPYAPPSPSFALPRSYSLDHHKYSNYPVAISQIISEEDTPYHHHPLPLRDSASAHGSKAYTSSTSALKNMTFVRPPPTPEDLTSPREASFCFSPTTASFASMPRVADPRSPVIKGESPSIMRSIDEMM